jgi:hypothetical protein
MTMQKPIIDKQANGCDQSRHISGAELLSEAATLVAMHLRNRLPRIPESDPYRSQIEAQIAKLEPAA